MATVGRNLITYNVGELSFSASLPTPPIVIALFL